MPTQGKVKAQEKQEDVEIERIKTGFFNFDDVDVQIEEENYTRQSSIMGYKRPQE